MMRKKSLVAVCALLCAAACAETVNFWVSWDVKTFTTVSYSKNGVKNNIPKGTNPPYKLTANVGDKISFTANLGSAWYDGYNVEDPVSGKKLDPGEVITMANAYSGKTFMIVTGDLKKIEDLGLYVNTNNPPYYYSDRGFTRLIFNEPKHTEPVKTWAEKEKKSWNGTVIKESYTLSRLQKAVSDNPERTYNSFLLDAPLLDVDPTLTISDMQIVSNKMKVVVSAHLNVDDPAKDRANLKDINGTLYMLTGETLEALEDAKKDWTLHFPLTYEEAYLKEQEARDHFSADRTYTVAGGKAYVTLDMTNVSNFVRIMLDTKWQE